MATVGNRFFNLADTYRQSPDNQGVVDIIEMLMRFNPALNDAHVGECNMGHQHLTSIRTGLPKPTWRKLYQAVQPTKGTTAQVKDATGMAEAWCEIEAKLVDMSKNPAMYRMDQAEAHIQGMSNEVEENIWYGDQTSRPEAFTGLAPRFSSRTAGNGGQIIDAGGTGSDNTSIWFVTWGEQFAKLLYPEGSMAGLRREDKGKQTKEVSSPVDGLYDVYREKFSWDIGLTLSDYRGIVRLANIDVSDLEADPADGGADLYKFMINAYHKLKNPGMGMGRRVIYCNETVLTYLDHQARESKNVRYALREVEGKEVLSFRGIPIHRADALLETEARVV